MDTPCPICNDPEHECWGLYKGLDDGAVTYTKDGPTNCPAWERDLLTHIQQIETVDQLRDCICWYCDPYPSGGMLHLTLEESAYTDEIITWQVERSTAEGYADPLGLALAAALLRFTPAEREWANRWETPGAPGVPKPGTGDKQ